MVKFGKYLEAHQIPEWSTQYVRYKRAKKLLKQVELEWAARTEAAESAAYQETKDAVVVDAEAIGTFPSNPAMLKFTAEQKQVLATVRARKQTAKQRLARDPATIDAELRTGQEWFARTRAAVIDTNRRLEEQKMRESISLKGRRLSRSDLTTATLEGGTASGGPSRESSKVNGTGATAGDTGGETGGHGSLDFTDEELNAEADGQPDDQKALDVALTEGKKHTTDSALVAEDKHMRKLTRYIPADVAATFTKGESAFFQLLEEDVTTINHFFLKQENFFLDKINIIVEQLDRLLKEEESHQARKNGAPAAASGAQANGLDAKDHITRMAAAAQQRENARGGSAAEEDANSPIDRELHVLNQHANIQPGLLSPDEPYDPARHDGRKASNSSIADAPNFHPESDSDHPQVSGTPPPPPPPTPPDVPPPPSEFPPTVDAPPSAASAPMQTRRLTRQRSSSGLQPDASLPDAHLYDADDASSSRYFDGSTRPPPVQTGAPALQTYGPSAGSSASSALVSHLPALENNHAISLTQPEVTPNTSVDPSPSVSAVSSAGSPNGSNGSNNDKGPDPATLAQHMHLHLKFRLLTAQKPWKVLEKALTELYRGLQLLRNYKILNFTAFVKILKKYDKLALRPKEVFHAGTVLLPRIQSTHFLASPILKAFIRRVELIFAQTFTDGDQKLALNNLRVIVPPIRSSVIFELGLLLGMSGIMLGLLLLMVGWVWGEHQEDAQLTFSATLRIWRGLALVILHIWGWGINVYLFRRYRINHEFIFEIDARTELKPEQLLLAAATMSTLWFVMIDVYFFVGLVASAGVWDAAPGWSPFTLFVGFLIICIMPLDTFFRPTRYYLLRTLGKIVTAPFYSIDFKDFYIADQLCSLVHVIGDFMFSACYLASGHFLRLVDADPECLDMQHSAIWVLACLPYWWRFLQCGRKYYDNPPDNSRQLWNMGKYSCSICTTLLSLTNQQYPDSGVLVAWIVSASISTIYSYSWDIYADWGFVRFEKGSRWPKLFSRKLVLPSRLPYYFAIVSNAFLRIAWVLTISPSNFGITLRSDVFTTLIYTAEVLRRNQWNFYRLENEHLTNCEHYRVVNIVPLKMNQFVSAKEESDEGRADRREKAEKSEKRPNAGGAGDPTSPSGLASPAPNDADVGLRSPLLARSSRLDESNDRYRAVMLTAPDARNLDPDRHDDPNLHEETFRAKSDNDQRPNDEEEDQYDLHMHREQEEALEQKQQMNAHATNETMEAMKFHLSPSFYHPLPTTHDDPHTTSPSPGDSAHADPHHDAVLDGADAALAYSNPFLQHYATLTHQDALVAAAIAQGGSSRKSSRSNSRQNLSIDASPLSAHSAAHSPEISPSIEPSTAPSAEAPMALPGAAEVSEVRMHIPADPIVVGSPLAAEASAMAPIEPAQTVPEPASPAAAIASNAVATSVDAANDSPPPPVLGLTPDAAPGILPFARVSTDPSARLALRGRARLPTERVPSIGVRRPITHGVPGGSAAAHLHLYGEGHSRTPLPPRSPKSPLNGIVRTSTAAPRTVGKVFSPSGHPSNSIIHRSRRLGQSHQADPVTQVDDDDVLRSCDFDQSASSGPRAMNDEDADDIFDRVLARRKSLSAASVTPQLAEHTLAQVLGPQHAAARPHHLQSHARAARAMTSATSALQHSVASSTATHPPFRTVSQTSTSTMRHPLSETELALLATQRSATSIEPALGRAPSTGSSASSGTMLLSPQRRRRSRSPMSPTKSSRSHARALPNQKARRERP